MERANLAGNREKGLGKRGKTDPQSLIPNPFSLKHIAHCTLLITSLFILHPSSLILAKTRLCVCILGDDTPGNFMGGSSLGSGLWVSDDTGKTFIQMGWKHGKTYSVDMVKSSKGKTIYIARGDGLLVTTDGGVSWRMLTDWRQTEVMDVAVNQKKPSDIIITTAREKWQSRDFGKTWRMRGKVSIPPRDRYTTVTIGDHTFVGSLDGWLKDGSKQIAFPQGQVWTIRTYEAE